MDQFTKRYLVILMIAVAALLVWWIAGLDSRVSKLNDILQSDSKLAAQDMLVSI